MKQENLYRLYERGILSLMDIHFAGFTERLAEFILFLVNDLDFVRREIDLDQLTAIILGWR